MYHLYIYQIDSYVNYCIIIFRTDDTIINRSTVRSLKASQANKVMKTHMKNWKCNFAFKFELEGDRVDAIISFFSIKK